MLVSWLAGGREESWGESAVAVVCRLVTVVMRMLVGMCTERLAIRESSLEERAHVAAMATDSE